jgi:hypothetical protein
MIKDADDAEKCAEEGYSCVLCRPSDTLPPHLRPPPKVIPPKIESPPKSPGNDTNDVIKTLISVAFVIPGTLNYSNFLIFSSPSKNWKPVSHRRNLPF